MKTVKRQGEVMLTELTPFQLETLLRCVSAVAHHLRHDGCYDEELYHVDDGISELSFSQDEVDVLSAFLRSYPDLEKRACYAPDSERQKPYSYEQAQAPIPPTYRIVARTNAYIARRDPMFSGHTEVILDGVLTLPEAQNELLHLYNQQFHEERPYADSWDVAVAQSAQHTCGAVETFPDGTRRFEYDSRVFSIEEETEQ